MNVTHLKWLLLTTGINLALAFASAPVQAEKQPRGHEQQQTRGSKGEDAKANEGRSRRHNNPPVQPDRQARSRDRAAHQQQILERQVAQQRAVKDRQAAQALRQAEHQRAVHTRVAERKSAQQQKQDAKHNSAQNLTDVSTRLSKNEQQANIEQQQLQLRLYRETMAQRQASYRLDTLQLQTQNRTAQYTYQQQYFQRVAEQQLGYQRAPYDYNNDPYFYTAVSYRYSRGGNDYQTNQYGADAFRQAMNYGYQEGHYAGIADRQDHWRFSYQDSNIYRDANYGYSGYYVCQDDYNHYFREGFQRGYEDGYYNRRQYAQRFDGAYSLLDAVLISVLNLQALR